MPTNAAEGTKRTAGKWRASVTKLHNVPHERQYVTIGTNEFSICKMTGSEGHVAEAMPDAEFICRAVNAHDALLAACEKVLSEMRACEPEFEFQYDTFKRPLFDMLKAAIALAEKP